MFLDAQPIWLTTDYRPDEYIQAAERFNLPTRPDTAVLRIAADSDYTVYINGQLAAFGQFANYPFRRVFDEVDICPFLRAGENEITLIGWYYGINCSTYRCGTPFVCFEIEGGGKILLASGAKTQVRPAPGYIPHRQKMISRQLGLTFAYDCTDVPGSFREAHIVDIGTPQWVLRPVEKLVLQARRTVEFVHQGAFRIPGYPGLRNAEPEKEMQHAALSFRTLSELTGQKQVSRALNTALPLALSPDDQADGIYWIVDLGAETAGFLDLDLEVPEACDLLVGYGEHLTDGRCRTAIRNFTCALRLNKGRNRFLNTFRRFGCRYLQFFLFSTDATVHYSGLRPTVYPVVPRKFCSGNLLRDTIYEVAQNTLLQCMHEHYEDCPWREQALYAMDSRNQMLCGYYAFGETRFPRASLELISYGQRPDGLLSLCYPAGTDLPIPSFSLVWVIAMREYMEYSGDESLARERFSVMEKLLETFANNRAENGLVRSFVSENTRYWNFYEWSDTMAGKDSVAAATPEAPLNAFYSLALQSMAAICRRLGKPSTAYENQAKNINRLLTRHFYHPERGLYASFTDRNTDRYSVLTNALCLLCGAADGVDTAGILQVLACNGRDMADCIPDTLSMNTFRFDAMLHADRDKYTPVVLEELDRTGLYMLRQGATTFWETIKGESDFDGAGSLCHGWSAMAIYYYETLCK